MTRPDTPTSLARCNQKWRMKSSLHKKASHCCRKSAKRKLFFQKSSMLFAAVHVAIHRLERDFAWPGEMIPANLARAREQTRRKFLEHRLHLHGAFLVDPAARLDVNL